MPYENEVHVGEFRWFELPMHTTFNDLNLEALREQIVQAYNQSGRSYARFVAVYAYAYPDNPAYNHPRLQHLKKLVHRWKADFTTSRISSGVDGVASLVDYAFSRQPKKKPRGARRQGPSVEQQAETRIVYVLRYMISTFDRKRETTETGVLLSRPER